jgi:glycosyltransferase involved in cell wall biosynthesis
MMRLRRLKLVIAPSKFMGTVIQCDFPHVPIVQIYNGAPLLPHQPLQLRDQPRLLFVGRLVAVKGADHLVRAMAQVRQVLPAVKLRIVGDGEQRPVLETLIRELQLGANVELAGWVKPEAIGQEFAASDVLVIPSVWPENLPTVAIEALSSGRPIVGTNTGGIPELIDDGRNGFIVEPGDAAGLATALLALLTDRKKLQQAGAVSAAKAQMFGQELFIKRLLDVYNDVLHEEYPHS